MQARRVGHWALDRTLGRHPRGQDHTGPDSQHREKRLMLGRAARTVNLDTIALLNVLKLARDRELIERLPETRQLKQRPAPKKTLLTKEQFATLMSATTADTTKNAELFRCYLRFLALTGAREKEALAVRWVDVDFTREVVTIGSGGVSKNHKSRDVDFSPELADLLQSMCAGRPPDRRPRIPADGAIPSDLDTLGYDAAKQRLLVGSGFVDNVPPAVWKYEVSGKQVLVQWFSHRRKHRERPIIGDRRPPSPLGNIQPAGWLPEYTTELINVLNVLGWLVNLEPSASRTAGEDLCGTDDLLRGTDRRRCLESTSRTETGNCSREGRPFLVRFIFGLSCAFHDEKPFR